MVTNFSSGWQWFKSYFVLSVKLTVNHNNKNLTIFISKVGTKLCIIMNLWYNCVKEKTKKRDDGHWPKFQASKPKKKKRKSNPLCCYCSTLSGPKIIVCRKDTHDKQKFPTMACVSKTNSKVHQKQIIIRNLKKKKKKVGMGMGV